VVNDSADVTSSGGSFHVCGPATGKARLPTVDSLLVGTTRRLVPTEHSDRRLGRSATSVKEPRYPDASVDDIICQYGDTELESILSGMRSQWKRCVWLSKLVSLVSRLTGHEV